MFDLSVAATLRHEGNSDVQKSAKVSIAEAPSEDFQNAARERAKSKTTLKKLCCANKMPKCCDYSARILFPLTFVLFVVLYFVAVGFSSLF